MSDALPHPELEACVPGDVVEAALALLRKDPALCGGVGGLGGYFNSIEDYEHEGFLLEAEKMATNKAPYLALLLEGFSYARDGSNRQARWNTAVRHLLVLPKNLKRGTERQLRARLHAHIIRAYERVKGQLPDPNGPDGTVVTEALLAAQRSLPVSTLPNHPNLIISRLDVEFQTRAVADTGAML